VLQQLYRSGFPVAEVDTRASRLEDVLIEILHGGGEASMNVAGLRTLFSKEVRRFLRVPVRRCSVRSSPRRSTSSSSA
jgi:hypothetical protein